jgi:YHS domain-containing protein
MPVASGICVPPSFLPQLVHAAHYKKYEPLRQYGIGGPVADLAIFGQVALGLTKPMATGRQRRLPRTSAGTPQDQQSRQYEPSKKEWETHRTLERPAFCTKRPSRCATLAILVLALGVVCATGQVFSAENRSNVREPSGIRIWAEKGVRRPNLDASGVILKGYDPVAYFTQKKAVKGNPKFGTTYQGATYYFSSAANLATFRKNPSKYEPQYGGFCADGIKHKREDDINPSVFFVINGKLYLCASPAAEKDFRSEEKENLKKADHNWYEDYEWFY